MCTEIREKFIIHTNIHAHPLKSVIHTNIYEVDRDLEWYYLGYKQEDNGD